MSVSLEPSTQLSFRKPFTSLVKQILRVNNHNGQSVAFKVKTTAPKLYCVRPNSGKIEPGGSVEVQVLLQPMKEEPSSLKCKDKFLVQSTMIAPELEHLSVNELWSAVTDDASKIHQQKLKVVYLPAEGILHEEDEPDASGMGHSSLLSHEGDASRYETTRHHYDTAKPHANGTVDNPGIPIFDNDDGVAHPRADGPPRPHTPDHAFSETQEHMNDEIQPVGRPSAASTIPMASYDQGADYSAKLAAANAEIAKLKALLLDASNNGSELRRRSRLFSDDGSIIQDGITEDGNQSVIVERVAQPEGVPLNVVAILSLVVFVVTYLFF